VRWRQATSGGVRAGMFADHVRSGVGVKRSGQPGMSTGGAPWGPVSTTPSKHARQVDETDGVAIRRLEDYGFGKGCQHVYETFLPLLSDLDQHVRAGRNVALILHDCTATVPNPKGEDTSAGSRGSRVPPAARRRSACVALRLRLPTNAPAGLVRRTQVRFFR